MSKNVQYIVNSNGERTGVIIALKEFENMLAEMRLTLDEFEKEPDRPLRAVLEQLRAAGELEF